jgi:hypothetical protein
MGMRHGGPRWRNDTDEADVAQSEQRMPTPKECRHNAETCLKLTRQTKEIYVRTALIEMAREFRATAEHSERGMRKPADRRQRLAYPVRHRR